jgi:hypothetical protein
MEHEISWRATDSLVTIGAFLGAFAAGMGTIAPSLAVVIGSTAAGIVAHRLARGDGDARSLPPAPPGLLRFSAPVAGLQRPVLAVFLLAGEGLLSIYGAGFREGAAWLAVLGLGHAVNAFVGLAETVISSLRPTISLRHSLQAGAVLLAFGLLLIPRLGAMGAALSVLLAYSGQALFRYTQLRRDYGWTWPWSSVRRPVVAFVFALAIGALVRTLVPGLGGQVAAALTALGAYGLGWWCQGGVDADDRAVLAQVFARKQAA